jgi:toxin ParE1/3/4
MRVVWRPRALEQLLEIIDFIAADSPHAAAEFGALVRSRTDALAAHPRLYREGRVAGTREIVVAANYVIVYSVDDEEQRVDILRVRHARQQPVARV